MYVGAKNWPAYEVVLPETILTTNAVISSVDGVDTPTAGVDWIFIHKILYSFTTHRDTVAGSVVEWLDCYFRSRNAISCDCCKLQVSWNPHKISVCIYRE